MIKNFPFQAYGIPIEHTDYNPSAIIVNDTQSGEYVDSEGHVHVVNVPVSKTLSLSDNIDKDIDADTLSMENCIKNNFNLQEITNYSTSSDAPENCVDDIDISSLSQKINPSSNKVSPSVTNNSTSSNPESSINLQN